MKKIVLKNKQIFCSCWPCRPTMLLRLNPPAPLSPPPLQAILCSCCQVNKPSPSSLSLRKVVDANHRERWVSNNTYWELRKNPGFINMENTLSLWQPRAAVRPAVTYAQQGVLENSVSRTTMTTTTTQRLDSQPKNISQDHLYRVNVDLSKAPLKYVLALKQMPIPHRTPLSAFSHGRNFGLGQSQRQTITLQCMLREQLLLA